MKYSVVNLFILMNCLCAFAQMDFKLLAQWKQLDFVFPSEQVRRLAIQKQQFIMGNAVPLDTEVHYRDNAKSRVFVTVPRFQRGIPVTLGTISSIQSDNGPLIAAYPDYSWHKSHGKDCNGITSVVRVAKDECNRLWVLDTGRIEDTVFCPPQILIFDLNTDRLIHRYKIPKGQYTDASIFVTPLVDVQDPPPYGQCLNTKAYLADVTAFNLVVYDAKTDSSWKINHRYFFPYPNFGTFTIAGESFDLMDGLLGMAITKNNGKAERYLYFHALASIHENRVPLRIIDDASLWKNVSTADPKVFKRIGSRGSQAAAQAFDSHGNLYYGLMNPIAVVCWDSNLPYKTENMRVVVKNDQTLQFVSGLKVIKDTLGHEELWAVSCRFQKVFTGTINKNEVNFRIQARTLNDLLGGQPKCTGQAATTLAYPRFAENDI